ncbi:MAG TPA: hypothetical protein VJ783_18490, partial [Pirellulales bacterium]|nr:hypothetical protein [Pirellulales bacterium]
FRWPASRLRAESRARGLAADLEKRSQSMMQFSCVGLLATALAAGALKSGPQVGDSVEAFQVVKCAGAEDDGVRVGQQLCYR